MDSKKSKLSTALTSFWFFSSASILISVAIAVWAYRLKFGGVLSDNSADWSNFGSYMGGIFGPLVSFITLLAVLKTVYMQRELLDAQKHEFSELNRVQILSLEKQDEQVRHAKSESDRSKIQAYQAIQIKSIESFIDLHQRETDKLEASITKILALDGATAEKLEAAELLLVRKKSAEKKVSELVLLSLEVSFKEYESVLDLKRAVGPKMLDILEGRSKENK
ncbi:hypothetical protein D3C84_575010 [compost metagenome]